MSLNVLLIPCKFQLYQPKAKFEIRLLVIDSHLPVRQPSLHKSVSSIHVPQKYMESVQPVAKSPDDTYTRLRRSEGLSINHLYFFSDSMKELAEGVQTLTADFARCAECSWRW
jgi:hypothetical protein